MALSYDVCVYILYDHPGFLSVAVQGSPYRDFAEIVRKPHSHSTIFTISVQKSHGAPVMSMWAPYDYLKSLRSFLGSIWLSKILWCPHDQRAVPERGSCDQPAMYLRATDLQFFKMCHSADLTKS